MKNRNEFADLLNKLNLKGSAAEIGVADGDFALEMLKTWGGKSYIMVDPWKRYPGYDDLVERDDEVLEAQYQRVVKKFENDPRAIILRGKSDEAANKCRDKSLCFVYIDAWHTYEACRADISHWWVKVKVGGILAGHDYGPSFGVKQAVDEFVKANNLILNVSDRETDPTGQSSWWVIKNG